MDGSVEALEFLVKEDVPGLTGLPLRDINTVRGVLIACIVRDGEVIIPSGADVILPGDTVVIVTSARNRMDNVGDIIRS